MLGDLFERLGSTIGTLDAQLRGAGDGRGWNQPHDADDGAGDSGAAGETSDSGDAGETVQNAALAAGGAWLLSRVLRPRDVSWPRVVFAGVAATILADLVGRAGSKTPVPGEEPYADDAEELMARFGAGIAIAAGYAALLYPRLPGPPLFRGLAFGALEIAAAPRGGLVRLATEAPGVKFPLQAMALPIDEDAGPLSHMAFGLALGMLYRYDIDDAELDDD